MVVGRHSGSRPGKAKSRARPAAGGDTDAMTADVLLPRVAAGDAEAFTRVCDQVSGAVYGLVRLIVPDQSRAEQVAADVLVEVWHSAAQFSPAQGSGLSWIMTKARRRARSAAEVTGAGHRAGPAPAGETALLAARAASSPSAHRGLTALPQPQREALLLACSGYTWRQVAVLTGAPASTVAEWLREGLRGLGSHLESPQE